jgi:transposase InsO family protein
LSRHGLVPTRRHRRRIGHPGKPTTLVLAPNDVWSAYYKGQFRTGDGRYCYPLTVADGFSRYLLGCGLREHENWNAHQIRKRGHRDLLGGFFRTARLDL